MFLQRQGVVVDDTVVENPWALGAELRNPPFGELVSYEFTVATRKLLQLRKGG
jgi:hypothetical protein